MKSLTDTGAAYDAVKLAHAELLEHTSSPAYRAFERWLDARVAFLQAEMLQADAVTLTRKQIEAQSLVRITSEMRPVKY